MRRSRSSSLLALTTASALLLSACGGDGDGPVDGNGEDAVTGTDGDTGPGTAADDGATDADTDEDEGTDEDEDEDDAPAAGESGGTVVMSITDDPGALDPQMSVLSVVRGVAGMAYDTLVRLDTDGNIVPSIASEWSETDDSVTFTLNPDVTCEDGSPFTAQDAADNINFVADPENASPLLGVLVPPGISAEADEDAGTVTVTASAPDAFLTRAFATLHMVCAAGLGDRESLAQDTSGTGPWVLETVVPGSSYTFTRNENYSWGPAQEPFEGEGVPDTLEIRVISNLTTAANQLLAGEINIAAVGPGDEQRVVDAGLEMYSVPTPLGQTMFNHDEGRIFADPDVRRAAAAATDIATVASIGGPRWRESTGLITLEPKVCEGDTVAGNLPEYDVAAANQMLDDAGWVTGSDGVREKDGQRLSLEFLYIQGGGTEVAAAAELLSQQWAEVGIEARPTVGEATQVNEKLFATGDWDAGWIPITLSLPSQLVGFVSGPTPPDGTNFAHIDNPTYDEQSAEALGTGDLDTACDLWVEAETALLEEVNVVPMFDLLSNTYLNGVTLDAPNGDIDGSSIRTTDQ